MLLTTTSGYRAVDSAQMYHNEKDTADAIREFLSSPSNDSNLTREDIHYTSKVDLNLACLIRGILCLQF